MNLKDKLTSELIDCSWDMLEPHFKRGALIFVDSELDIIEVGMAIAQDSTEQVKKWLSSGKIKNVDDTVAKKIKADFEKFSFLILQPYVIFQAYNLQ